MVKEILFKLEIRSNWIAESLEKDWKQNSERHRIEFIKK